LPSPRLISSTSGTAIFAQFCDHWSLGRLLVDVEPVELVELFDHCRGRWYDFRV
jgi:hypothetical protein